MDKARRLSHNISYNQGIMWAVLDGIGQVGGGGSGIRTHDTVPRIHTFQACAFNHSATPPHARLRGRT